MKNSKTQYALIEQGSIHTDYLDIDQANEMLERHSRFFPEINWAIVPMSETKGRERLLGYLERQRNTAVKYLQP